MAKMTEENPKIFERLKERIEMNPQTPNDSSIRP
jgi:hypothetical protein